MQKLIINADDFGYTKEINQGILDGHRFGTITSTTIMTNEKEFDHAIGIYPKSLGMGVHLNLTWGNSLITGKPFSKNNKYKAVLGRINPEFVEKEYRSQIEKLLEVGIRPDHLDSHQHLHAFSPMRKVIVQLAEEYHIYKIRWPKEKHTQILPSMSFINQKIINLKIKKCPIKTTDHFFGVLHTGQPRLKHFLSYLNFEGTAEICCHPGKQASQNKDRLYKTRQKELDILTNDLFLNTIKEKNIQLITFKEL
ncbi:ChbG/HpnK family deacetylase [Candidatus Woesearchaeota archaeon]|nr:ChbG/HpnK family deacetylase [Candidatus Woesearchaeota archaeon]